MASETKLEGLGRNPDALTVQKSQPLFALWESRMQLNSFKILDLYLSRIDSHHPEVRSVTFTKGEIEKVLGVDRIRNEDLDKAIDGVMQVVDLPSLNENDKKNKIVKIALFEKATATRAEDGLWTVTLKCTESAMQYIFNIENLGYLRYKLAAVRKLKSRYSYVLFNYLESNRFRVEWDVPIDELKKILGCYDTPTYSEYRRFSELILKKAQKELEGKSGCVFTFKPVKQGQNHVVAVHFRIESIYLPLDSSGTTELEPVPALDLTANASMDPGANYRTFMSEAVNNEFTPAQMDALLAALTSVPEKKFPYGYTMELARYNYLHQKYTRMNARDEQQGKAKIKNRYQYILRMIQADTKPE